MRKIITVKNCESKIEKETGSRNPLPPFGMSRIPVLVVILTMALLIFILGGESAYSQCAGLCLYEPDTSETTIRAKPIGPENREHTKDHFVSEGARGADSALLAPDPRGEPGRHNSGIFPSERIRLAQDLSDNFTINDMYSTERVSENSSTDVDAANDAEANSNPQTSKTKDWEFILIPYGWLSSISEDIVVNGRGADAHATFIDLLEHLDIAAMFHGEVWWKGRFGIYADIMFSKLAINKDVSLRRFGSTNANLTTTMFIQEFGALYRVGTWPVGSPYNKFVQRSKPSVTFDILAGGRYWHLNNELDLNGPLGILPSEIDQSQNWFDFIAGGRARLDFYKKLFLELSSDIGGFDLSFSSKFSWNIIAVAGYESPWYRITPLIGFRALYDNYANGSGNTRFEAKTWMYGPLLGVAFKF